MEVALQYKCPVSFRCRFHFDGNGVYQALTLRFRWMGVLLV